jgi:hypothetical protein
MQLQADRIDLAATPLPAAQREYFMVSLNVRSGTVRPRTVEVLLTEHDARTLWGLRRGQRFDVEFTVQPTDQRHGFLAIDQVRFDTDRTQLLPMYTVSQVHKITKFSA